MWQVQLFVDNTVALGCILREASSQASRVSVWLALRGHPRAQEDYNWLVGKIWLTAARNGASLAAWFVPSRLNIADVPTRPHKRARDMSEMHRQGFARREWMWPDELW